jgi:hypothetical protein
MARAEFTRAELAAAIYGTTLSVEETRAYINRAFGRTQDAALLTADRMFVLHAGVRQHVFGKLATLLSPRNVTVTGKDGAFDIPVTVYADVFARVPEARVLVASAPCGAGKTNAVVAYVNDPRLPLPVACDGRVCVRALFVASRIAEVEKLYADIVRSCPWMRCVMYSDSAGIDEMRASGTSATDGAIFTTYHSLATVLLRLVDGRDELENLLGAARARADAPIMRFASVMMPVVLSLGCLERLRIGALVVDEAAAVIDGIAVGEHLAEPAVVWAVLECAARQASQTIMMSADAGESVLDFATTARGRSATHVLLHVATRERRILAYTDPRSFWSMFARAVTHALTTNERSLVVCDNKGYAKALFDLMSKVNPGRLRCLLVCAPSGRAIAKRLAEGDVTCLGDAHFVIATPVVAQAVSIVEPIFTYLFGTFYGAVPPKTAAQLIARVRLFKPSAYRPYPWCAYVLFNTRGEGIFDENSVAETDVDMHGGMDVLDRLRRSYHARRDTAVEGFDFSTSDRMRYASPMDEFAVDLHRSMVAGGADPRLARVLRMRIGCPLYRCFVSSLNESPERLRGTQWTEAVNSILVRDGYKIADGAAAEQQTACELNLVYTLVRCMRSRVPGEFKGLVGAFDGDESDESERIRVEFSRALGWTKFPDGPAGPGLARSFVETVCDVKLDKCEASAVEAVWHVRALEASFQPETSSRVCVSHAAFRPFWYDLDFVVGGAYLRELCAALTSSGAAGAAGAAGAPTDALLGPLGEWSIAIDGGEYLLPDGPLLAFVRERVCEDAPGTKARAVLEFAPGSPPRKKWDAIARVPPNGVSWNDLGVCITTIYAAFRVGVEAKVRGRQNAKRFVVKPASAAQVDALLETLVARADNAGSVGQCPPIIPDATIYRAAARARGIAAWPHHDLHGCAV